LNRGADLEGVFLCQGQFPAVDLDDAAVDAAGDPAVSLR
jgi:hypothetical protein